MIRELNSAGHPVIAPPNPLRSPASDAADVPADLADVMSATQRPLPAAALTENATAAGWRTRPSWFLVSEHDNAIPPDAERFMAKRMGAVTESISGSHTAFIANPVCAASFITKALAG